MSSDRFLNMSEDLLKALRKNEKQKEEERVKASVEEKIKSNQIELEQFDASNCRRHGSLVNSNSAPVIDNSFSGSHAATFSPAGYSAPALSGNSPGGPTQEPFVTALRHKGKF